MKQIQAFSEHRAFRNLSGTFKVKEQKSNIHSPRNSQLSHKETLVGLQRITKDLVESLSKALTPNCRVRQNSPKQIIENQEQKVIQKPDGMLDNLRQVMHQIENNQEQKELANRAYINFTKFARKISQQPIKEIKIIQIKKTMTRQRSIDFSQKQDEWLKQKNEKVLKQRIEKEYLKHQKENKIIQIEKSKTDRFY